MTYNNNPNEPQQGGSYDSYPSAPQNGQAPTGYDQQQYGNGAAYGTKPASKVKSIISLVLGILSVLSCIIPIMAWLTGIAGLILGILASKSERPAKGLWMTGIILSAVGLLLGTILFIVGIISIMSSGQY